MINKSTIVHLLLKYLTNNLSKEEQAQLEEWMEASPENRSFIEERMKKDRLDQWRLETPAVDEEAIRRQFEKQVRTSLQRKRQPFPVAAAVLVIAAKLAIIAFIVDKCTAGSPKQMIAVTSPRLTLDNGRYLILDSLKIGTGAVSDGWWVTRTGPQKIEYYHYTNLNKPSIKPDATIHTLSIPAGHPWELVLPDGSSVVLNEASALSYTIAPSGSTRKEIHLLLEGEAFFDIHHDPYRPCTVETNKGTIMVLGTRFNVHDYQAEEALVVSLLTGSLMVSNGKKRVMLKPGQEASMEGWNDSIGVTAIRDTTRSVLWLHQGVLSGME